ncbi:MAG TPA: hypothetical protein VEV43_08420 [Actinomycetota bacterium]|nr:hypothetical protein [Actinomycetota bacterium]
MTRQVTRLTASTVVLALTLLSAPAWGVHARQAPTSPQCISADFSPEFVTDRKGFCVAFDTSDGDASTFRFFLTSDGGRTWARRAATGFAPGTDEIMGSVIASPGYAKDRTVFVQTNRGVFSTVDDGASFALVDNFAATGPSGPNLSAFVDDAVGLPGSPEGERPVLALAAGDASVKIDPPHRIPVTGAPLDERRFSFPGYRDGERLAYTMTVEVDNTQGITSRSRNVLFRCNEQLVCAEPLFAFPWGYQFEPRGGLWFAPDFSESERIYATTSKLMRGLSTLKAFRSKDGGATFRPWASVNRMLRPIRRLDGSTPTIGLGLHPTRPRTIYMRLGYRLPADAEDRYAPVERFFVSRDRGRTWDLLSFARDAEQRGPRGTIPWDGTWGYPVNNFVSVTGDGTIFVMARDLGGHSGLYCSTDGGRTWAATCR